MVIVEEGFRGTVLGATGILVIGFKVQLNQVTPNYWKSYQQKLPILSALPGRALGRGSTSWDQREEDIHTFHLAKNRFKKTWP